MRMSTLLYLVVFSLTFGFYFFTIEPLINYVWQRFLIFMLLLISLNFLVRKLELHFKFLNKRIDNHLSVWIVIGLLSTIIVIGMVNP
ncbi:drug/metabolite transporter (DMT)-like permease [Bacillus luteolus]|nr:drug/metabolite transporter (DMT)-like permease [Cytobacillus luteolus]